MTTPDEGDRQRDRPPSPRVLGVAASVEWRSGARPTPLWRHLPSCSFFASREVRYHDLAKPWTPPALGAGLYAVDSGEETSIYAPDEGRWAALTPALAAWFLAVWTGAGDHSGDWMVDAFRVEARRRWPGAPGL